MGLTLVTNPVGSASSKMFAGFQKCEVVFKREDIAVIDVEAGTGGAKFNHAGDLTSVLSIGDTIYVYSVGTNYTYDGSYQILDITAGEITISASFIESATGGYINYLKNYYVELQCVNPTLPEVNLLDFSLQSDGDAKGDIIFDVSIVNELNRQRGAIAQGAITESVKEFEIKYREVYQGSSNSFTLVDNKLFIMLYAIDKPEQDIILNKLDMPNIYLGYPAAMVLSIKARTESSTIELVYNELDINKQPIAAGTLGTLASDINSFLLWLWPNNKTVNQQSRYIDFNTIDNAIFDFATPDFATPDFVTE